MMRYLLFCIVLLLGCKAPEVVPPRWKEGDSLQIKLTKSPCIVTYVYGDRTYVVRYQDQMGELETINLEEYELEPLPKE